MKKLIGILSLIACFSFTKGPEHPADATIYIYRTGQWNGAGNNWAMFVDEKKICKLSNNKYIKVTVPAGKHMISSKIGGVGMFKKETEIEIEAEAGGNYYVACNIKTSFTRSRLEMLEVTKSSAEKQMKDMALDNCQEDIDAAAKQ
ncbi:MAG TPA: DUF2846 domain-containing protein [Flavisolibacter sp.]|jgi:hypothetical protein|nr:DUF2846 domain-containing protein [Flavisolibacter sp.]